MLDNIDHAILTKVNQLASRYGLEPYDFIATLQPEQLPEERFGGELDSTGRTILAYETFLGDEKKRKSFERKLESVGVDDESSRIIGKDKEILIALDSALKRAPKPRSPFD